MNNFLKSVFISSALVFSPLGNALASGGNTQVPDPETGPANTTVNANGGNANANANAGAIAGANSGADANSNSTGGSGGDVNFDGFWMPATPAAEAAVRFAGGECSTVNNNGFGISAGVILAGGGFSWADGEKVFDENSERCLMANFLVRAVLKQQGHIHEMEQKALDMIANERMLQANFRHNLALTIIRHHLLDMPGKATNEEHVTALTMLVQEIESAEISYVAQASLDKYLRDNPDKRIRGTTPQQTDILTIVGTVEDNNSLLDQAAVTVAKRRSIRPSADDLGKAVDIDRVFSDSATAKNAWGIGQEIILPNLVAKKQTGKDGKNYIVFSPRNDEGKLEIEEMKKTQEQAGDEPDATSKKPGNPVPIVD